MKYKVKRVKCIFSTEEVSDNGIGSKITSKCKNCDEVIKIRYIQDKNDEIEEDEYVPDIAEVIEACLW